MRGQIGASMVEFALLVALIALIAIPAVKGLGIVVSDSFYHIQEKLVGDGQICNPQNPAWPACNPP